MIDTALRVLRDYDPLSSADTIAVTFTVLMFIGVYGVAGFLFGIAVGMARRRNLHEELQTEADALAFLRVNRYSLQCIEGIWAVVGKRKFASESGPRAVVIGIPSANVIEAVHSAMNADSDQGNA